MAEPIQPDQLRARGSVYRPTFPAVMVLTMTSIVHRFLPLVFVLTALYTCGTTTSAQPTLQGNLQEITTIGEIGEEKGKRVLYVGDMLTDSLGNLYVSDLRGRSLHKYDASGRMLAKGTGSRDDSLRFQGWPRMLLSLFKDTLTVVELRSVHRFTTALEHVGTRSGRLEGSPSPTTIGHGLEGDLYVGGIAHDREQRLRRYDSAWHYKSSPPRSHVPGHHEGVSYDILWDFHKLCIDAEGRLIVAYPYSGYVEVLSAEDSLLSTFSILKFRDPPKESGEERARALPVPVVSEKARAALEEIRKLPSEYFFYDMAVGGSGWIYILAGGYAEHSRRDIYVYDVEGKLLTTIVLPEEAWRLHVDHEEYLYVAVQERTLIKKYKLRYSAP